MIMVEKHKSSPFSGAGEFAFVLVSKFDEPLHLPDATILECELCAINGAVKQ